MDLSTSHTSFTMHHIKRKARAQAWYHNDDDPENRTYNPFARVRTRSNYRGDEENALHHANTENDLESPVENSRIAKNEEDLAEHRGPRKAGTFPVGPGSHGGMPSGERSRGDIEKVGEEREASSAEYAQPQLEQQTSSQDRSLAMEDGPRHRKGGKFMGMFHKKDKEEIDSSDSDTQHSKKKVHRTIPVGQQFKAVFGSWINILLIFVPIGIALNYAHVNKIAVFVVNFVAIIPLAAILSFATEELAMYIGEVLGGLLNASFGNAVELIVGIIALVQGKVVIVQTSLVGSMLSNLLLVLGMCFFLGGINRSEQHFNLTVAQTAASLLALAIGSLIIPTAFAQFASTGDRGVTPTSRGTCVLLLVVYGCYLLFQLRTHSTMYNEPSKKTPKRSTGRKDSGEASKGIAMIGAASGAATAGGRINQQNILHEDPEEEETPSVSIIGSLITLAIATVFIALCAEYMVSAIDAVTDGGAVSEEFVGLILLPIVGNAAEHATAVTVAIKDKMDLSIGVAVGSSLQIALLVLPIMVMLSWWGVGPATLDLNFDGFLVIVLVLSIWLVNYLINDGKSHWLEGVMLMLLYMIIAIAAWFYPAPEGLE